MSKVMFYINALNGGGAERVMVNLANFLIGNKVEVIFVTSYYAENEYVLDKKIKRLSLEDKEVIQSRVRRNLSRISKLRKICKEERADILVSFMAEPNFRAILATRGIKIKTLVSVRNDPNKEYSGKLGNLVGKVLMPVADGCVFQTVDAKKWFPIKLQKKSKIIYNAVKEEFYQIERRPVSGEIITCGRLAEQKNHSMLIAAFADIEKQYKNVKLKIYGEGELEDALQEQIRTLGLQEKVFLMGATNNVEKALQTADLFVLTSDYEGMPNALMEAMAAGVPCISTNCPCGGPKELFGEPLLNQLIPVNDGEALKEAIQKFCNMTLDEKKQLGVKMKSRAMEFRPEIINDKWLKYLEEIVG